MSSLSTENIFPNPDTVFCLFCYRKLILEANTILESNEDCQVASVCNDNNISIKLVKELQEFIYCQELQTTDVVVMENGLATLLEKYRWLGCCENCGSITNSFGDRNENFEYCVTKLKERLGLLVKIMENASQEPDLLNEIFQKFHTINNFQKPKKAKKRKNQGGDPRECSSDAEGQFINFQVSRGRFIRRCAEVTWKTHLSKVAENLKEGIPGPQLLSSVYTNFKILFHFCENNPKGKIMEPKHLKQREYQEATVNTVKPSSSMPGGRIPNKISIPEWRCHICNAPVPPLYQAKHFDNFHCMRGISAGKACHCDLCPAYFRNNGQLLTHKVFGHYNKKCPKCGNVFGRHKDFLDHNKVCVVVQADSLKSTADTKEK